MLVGKQAHPWLRNVAVAYVAGPATPLLGEFVGSLMAEFARQGHRVLEQPDTSTDVILTSARFLEPLDWRRSMLFTARRQYHLEVAPTVFTLIHATPPEFEQQLARLETALARDPSKAADFAAPGLNPGAWRTLLEQGERGGPLLALVRLLQAQAKCLRIVLLVGDTSPVAAYHFDLVGSHPRTDGQDRQAFYEDIVLRIVTAVSTGEVASHRVVGPAVPAAVWQRLATPGDLVEAGRSLGKRGFFTEMVIISNLVQVPAISDAVASQYSEGCFATWEPALNGLVATVTGSSRPVDKTNLTVDDLAVIVGVRADGMGAEVRHVDGTRNDPPSSEAVEMMLMDAPLPRITLPSEWGIAGEVPIIRSKLHGHRGVAAYDARHVEFVPLALPFYDYPVSCATDAQARAICEAFSRSDALHNLVDPRQVAFTILPGHGVVLAEKWVAGKRPLQVIWEMMDDGRLEIATSIPQGRLTFDAWPDGRLHVRAL